ncbi:MAG: hypothetical protein ACK4L8_02865 [Nitrincola lacisaponensis]|uniref:Uncharacterized protein n=1 Tax=Nitrincola lacisaponensis TaxID=267850 RepID=A0A063Y5X9_9GAMM|nr:hypothetical protein [Nitrincola lacisaponensis]KDE40530.1 hypothetical protein ADINL_1122 [Nitrincola lacisaponensis]
MALNQAANDLYIRRVEEYTAGLPQAVRAPGGAEFSLLLSLIAASHERSRPLENTASEPAVMRYPEPDSLLNVDMVSRLNHAVTHDERGEYAYLVSYLRVRSETPLQRPLMNDRFAQLSLASLGGQMLDQITASREGFQAVA